MVYKGTRDDPRLETMSSMALALHYCLIVYAVTILFEHIAYTVMLSVFGGMVAALVRTAQVEIPRIQAIPLPPSMSSDMFHGYLASHGRGHNSLARAHKGGDSHTCPSTALESMCQYCMECSANGMLETHLPTTGSEGKRGSGVSGVPHRLSRLAARLTLSYWGVLLLSLGAAIYFSGILLSMVRIVFFLHDRQLREWNSAVLFYSGVPSTMAVLLIAADLLLLLPIKRKTARRLEVDMDLTSQATVVLTAYNDEASIRQAVADFQAHPRVRRVIVVDNNSRDSTATAAHESGAIVIIEEAPGYGRCVYRCLQEAHRYEDTDEVVLCEGDCTFRARDIHKLFAFMGHADVVNGTRIVEQLRNETTQLTTFMYYGNFFVGKLLEVKHLGQGTFTDVGTTYKMIRRKALPELLRHLDPRVNLEFNAHFMDTVLSRHMVMVECPVTFHPRVGLSKGGNSSDWKALTVGLRMILGLSFGWRIVRLVAGSALPAPGDVLESRKGQ